MYLKQTTSFLIFLFFLSNSYAQTADSTETRRNTSEEIVTKTIRIKGANGEEKIIEQQEVITKTSSIELNPEDQDKTNQSANYLPAQVQIKKSGISTHMMTYSKIANETGYVITLHDQNGENIAYAMLLSNGYYLLHLGDNNNSIAHFDSKNQLIVERFDVKTKSLKEFTYELLPIKQ